MGALRASELARRLRQSGTRVQLLLGDAVPIGRAAHARESRSGFGGDSLLADQLCVDGSSRGRRLFPRAVSSRQSAALQAGLRDLGRGQRPRPLRRNLRRLGRQQLRLVGRGGNQVLSRRRRISDHLRHGHGGLFLRGLQFRRRHGRSVLPPRLCRVHDALFRDAAGHPARRNLSVAAALRALSLAHHGSDPLRARLARHVAGDRMADGKG